MSYPALEETITETTGTLRPKQHGHHFADDIFKRIFAMKIFEFRLIFH